MRRGLGWLLVVLGSIVAVVGTAAAIIVGPDDRVTTGPHTVASKGAAIITAPAALGYSGPRLEATAEAPDRKVFVGLAHDVDVGDYLSTSAYARIDTIDLPWSTTTSAVDGDRTVTVLPQDVDFWLVSDSGNGRATVQFPLPDAAVDLVLMDAEGKPGLEADLTLTVVQDGAFVAALAAVVVGLGIAVVGWLRLRHASRRGRRRAARKPLSRRRSSGGRRVAGQPTRQRVTEVEDSPEDPPAVDPAVTPRASLARRLAAVGLTFTLAGCALPHHKAVEQVSKAGATVAVADVALASYGRERAAAEATLDTGVLGDLEAGSMLAVDESSFAIRRALGISARPFVLDDAATIWAPRFTAYPLWFVALTRLPQQQQQAVLVFARESSTQPWLVEAGPRLAGDTEIPTVAQAADATVARYLKGTPDTWSDGAPVELKTPLQQVADDYADVLTHQQSPHAQEFVQDSFIAQMRQVGELQPDQGVRFDQHWTARPVHYALRLADGGALMFVTLRRIDSFEVQTGNALSFAGSEAGVYLPGKVRHQARLTYEHQVLMVVPGDGKPLVIGQFGGLVSARGH